jgi:ATP-dependent Lhr-like helicase
MLEKPSVPEANRGTFELLHSKIQQQLYAMRWTELRPIQVDTIQEIILRKNNRIVISAQTAGGKTEAAFLPILSGIVENYSGSVQALYVGPLKALINDQFRRLEDLCQRASIPVHRWHGDVSQSAKNALIKKPSGVLLITPESLESLFVNRPQHINSLFARLAFIVIDEMHSFMGTERGAHLKSLICRAVPRTQEKVSLIGLSATLGDMNDACKWLCLYEDENVALIADDTDEKTIRYMIHGYLRSKSERVEEEENTDGSYGKVFKPDVTSADERLAEDIYKAFNGKTALIFANSKAKLEFYADLVRRRTERKRLPNSFRVHHGSLGKSEREDTEEDLRSNRATAVFCSSTLEMGIDIGNVSIVGQIGSPWSVNSLIQRLGRSGRQYDQASVMRMLIEEYEPDDSTPLIKRLYPNLLQAVGMSELMLEKWCEPPELNRIHASTFVHQIMSIIAEVGGISADKLFDILIERGAFSNISKNMFIHILHSLGDNDIIEQIPEGDLILGLEGEKIVRRFDFYAAFRVDEELRVMHKDRCIGSVLLNSGTGAEGFIILAGRRWKIIEVDMKRREIMVVPSRGGRLPFFSGGQGPDIHTRIRQKMREVLFSDKVPLYLDPKAGELLEYAREVAINAKLDERDIYKEGSNIIWFTWTGSRINRTLMGLGRFYGELNVLDDGIALTFEDASIEEIKMKYRGFLKRCPPAEELAVYFPTLIQEKFDEYLSDGILAQVFAHNYLDINGALNLIVKLINSP